MLELFDSYLVPNVSPEYRSLLTHVYLTLEEAGQDKHISEIEQTILEFGDDRDRCIQAIHQLLTMTLNDAIMEYGVTVEDNLLINCDLLSALSTLIDDYEDHDYLDTLLGSVDDPTDVLVEILGVVTTRSAEEYLTVILDTSPRLIDRIETIVSAKIEAPTMDVSVISQTVKRFNQWRRLYKDQDNLLAVKAIYDGAHFTTPLKDLIHPHLSEIANIKDLSDRAIQILGFTLASDCAFVSLADRVSQVLEQTGVNPFDISTAMRSVHTTIKSLDAPQ
jgi:hypothetical protein